MSNETENKEVEIDNSVEAVEEETSNAGTIAAQPTNVSRSELMAMMVDYATKCDRDELASFVAKLPTPANVQPDTPDSRYQSVQNAINSAPGNAGSNKASIKSSGAPAESMPALPSVKEDLNALFGNDASLSEDFRIKTEALFEAAVATRVGLQVAKIKEDYEAANEAAITSLKEEMLENVDAYLNYAVAEWMDENKLAVESDIRTEIAESFLSGLKSLFEEHYVDIPEDKVDVVETMAARIDELEAQINETTEKNIELSKIVSEKEVTEIANKLSEGLTDTQKEKFVKLIEAVNYSSADEFSKKASVIKETYFSSKGEVKVAQDQLLSESVDEPEKPSYVAPEMQAYVQSLTRIQKK